MQASFGFKSVTYLSSRILKDKSSQKNLDASEHGDSTMEMRGSRRIIGV